MAQLGLRFSLMFCAFSYIYSVLKPDRGKVWRFVSISENILLLLNQINILIQQVLVLAILHVQSAHLLKIELFLEYTEPGPNLQR